MIQTSQSIQRSEEIMQALHYKLRDPKETLSDIDIFMNEMYYILDDFLQYNDREFILHLYVGILKRHPDTKGLTQWVKQLKDHKKTKLEILYTIRYSEEGISQNVSIIGLIPPDKSAISRIKPAISRMRSLI